MFKKLLVIAALFATGVACAGIRIDATYRDEKTVGQFDENKNAILKFSTFTLNVTEVERTSNGLSVMVIVGAENDGQHAVIEQIDAPWNEAVTLTCVANPEELVTITATEEPTEEQENVVTES
jgi:hypothetical protein